MTPKIGDQLWYWPDGCDEASGGQPLPATVAYVHPKVDPEDDDELPCVNVGFLNKEGRAGHACNIEVFEGDGDDTRPEGAHCEWPHDKTEPDDDDPTDQGK